MIRAAALAAVVMVLAGCGEDYRNSPSQQVEDYAICKKAGMRASETVMGEIRCSPGEVRP